MLTRRTLLYSCATAAVLRPLAAGTSDFWDKKPPSEWSSDEIDRLLTKSPWSKEVNAQYAPGQQAGGGGQPDGGYPDSTGYPGGRGGTQRGGGISIPGVGIPGIGGIGFPR